MLAFLLLGKPSIQLNHQSLPITIQKAYALLFYLAVQQRAVSRQEIVGLLWAEVSEEAARRSLRVLLTKIRPMLGDYLVTTRRDISLNWQLPISCDLHSFLAALEQDALEEAIELYSADLLQKFHVEEATEFTLWQVAEQERLRQMYGQALHQLLAVRLANERWADAETLARRLLAVDDWDEVAYRGMIEALARQGKRAAAVAEYERCCKLLREEIGVEPSAETEALIAKVKDGQFDSIATMNQRPLHNLPAATTSFVGRSAEIEQLIALLTGNDCRLLTIVGLGGMGKTRLSLEVAQRLVSAEQFADGVFFVELAGVKAGQPDALLLQIIEALQLPLGTETTTHEALLRYLRSRTMLLVLDNLEHLVDQAELLVNLLQEAPNLKLLATSRRTLRLHEEWLFELNGLTVTNAATSGLPAAIELFAQCTKRLVRNFEFDANRTVVEQICQMMEGMPLGIELAAGWTRRLTCAEIVDVLHDNLGGLESWSRNVPSRHVTMQAVFDHSWAQLAASEREQLAALSVFHGGFTSEAAAAVVGVDARVLSELLDHSLLRRDASGRYSMHELLRQFSAEKRPAAIYQKQHSDYFAHWMQTHYQHVRTGQEEASVTAVITDIANVRAGWQWALTHAEGCVIDYVLMLQLALYRRSWYQEGGTLFAAALADLVPRTDETAQQETLALLRFAHGKFLSRLGQKIPAIAFFEQATATLVAQRKWFKAALVYASWAYALIGSGNFDSAQEKSDLALFAAANSEQESTIEQIKLMLTTTRASIALKRGNWDEAVTLFREGLAYSLSVGHKRTTAVSYNNLATTEFRRGNYAAALPLEQRAVAMAREMDEPLLVGIDLKGLGDILLAMGEIDSVEAKLTEALQIFRQMGVIRWQTTTLATLGDLYRQQGRLAESRVTLEEAITLAEAEGLRPDLLRAWFEFGRLLLDQQEHEQAVTLLKRVLTDPACDATLVTQCQAVLDSAEA